jgi:hypothetical protein
MLGFLCLFLGMLFILLLGPEVIFIPLGLAMLSLKRPRGEIGLNKSQHYFRQRR